jgi:hypothetical protein
METEKGKTFLAPVPLISTHMKRTSLPVLTLASYEITQPSQPSLLYLRVHQPMNIEQSLVQPLKTPR